MAKGVSTIMQKIETQGFFAGAAKGMVWTYASFAASKLLVFISSVILARLLLPAQFGQVGFALLVISYLDTIGSFGISEALIYEQKRSDEAAHIAFWFNVLTGLFWTSLVMLVAPAIATFF